MAARVKREIIKIDEDLCDGCGECVPSCAEGAIQIIDGKARLVSEIYCDGLGACLGECPQGAISMEEREAEPFDEEAVEKYLETLKDTESTACASTVEQEIPRGEMPAGIETNDAGEDFSELVNWPVKLKLVSPEAEFLKKPQLVISADCVPFAFGNFHRRFLKGRPLLIGCPKLDDTTLYFTKLTEIFKTNNYEKVTVVYMEIPCCSGLYGLVEKALEEADSKALLQSVNIGVDGQEISNSKR
ncbi:4Fe-4S binding protein [Candidatus Contubernalis alkalaceticus]|nr:4Fe-4S binding protein [Candidatus Contubernalis alkalaceticus]